MAPVSHYYEVVFSFFLRPDTPGRVLDELRWQLGLTPQRPRGSVMGDGEAMLRPAPETLLPGVECAALERQHVHTRRRVAPERADGDAYMWGLYARVCWHDDTWANHWLDLADGLARHAEDSDYAGFFRAETDGRPTLLSIRDGRAYLCPWGGEPIPVA